MIKRIKDIYEAYRLSKYYQSIKECPMYNWICVSEEEDLKYLSKTGNICKRAIKVYNNLQDQIVDKYGINQDFMEILRNKMKIEMLYADVILNKDRSLLTKIEILEIKNEELEAKITKGDIYELVMAIEKNLGFKLDVRAISIDEFFKYTKILK